LDPRIADDHQRIGTKCGGRNISSNTPQIGQEICRESAKEHPEIRKNKRGKKAGRNTEGDPAKLER